MKELPVLMSRSAMYVFLAQTKGSTRREGEFVTSTEIETGLARVLYNETVPTSIFLKYKLRSSACNTFWCAKVLNFFVNHYVRVAGDNPLPGKQRNVGKITRERTRVFSKYICVQG